MRIKHVLVILVLLALALPSSAHAGGVVTVCDEAHLLAALAGGGTVTFACSGVITLSNTIVIAADTTIDGSGQEVTISGNNAVRVFMVNAGSTLNLNRLTVALGRSDAGGVVANSGALTVSNSVFSSNSAVGNGGSIFVPVCYADCGDISLTVSDSTFSGNSAGARGGGIFISPYCYENCGQMTVTVSNSTFSGNGAGAAGGAIYHDGDYNFQNVTLTVAHSTFTYNTAGTASAIFSGNWTTLMVSDSAFTGNRGACIATAIYSNATLTVAHSSFIGNSDDGIRNAKWNDLTVSHSTFAGNGGCGIDSYDATLSVSDSTFADNGDCGISNGDDNGTATVANCTFANNGGDGRDIHNAFQGRATVSNSTFASTSAGRGGISNGVEATLTMINSTLHGVPVINSPYDGTLTLKNTIVAHSSTGSNCTGEITDGGGNVSYPDTTCPGINADPVLGPLQDNGGPTWTMEPGPGSPAIDAGNDATCAAPPVNNLDQRGVIRPVGPHCDMGAVEVNYLPWRKWLPIMFAQ